MSHKASLRDSIGQTSEISHEARGYMYYYYYYRTGYWAIAAAVVVVIIMKGIIH